MAEYVTRWAFQPAAGRESKFLRAYGPDGPWVALFSRAAGYLGTTLEPHPARAGWYVTEDRWSGEADYRAFRAAFAAEYAALDTACESLTAAEECLDTRALGA